MTGDGALGAAGATLTSTGRVYAGVPESPTTEELAEWLRLWMSQVQREINGIRADMTRVGADLGHGIAEARVAARNADALLETRLLRAMTDRILAELRGLFLVVMGTVLSALG